VFADIAQKQNAQEISVQLKYLDRELGESIFFLTDQFLPEQQSRVRANLRSNDPHTEYAKEAKLYLEELSKEILASSERNLHLLENDLKGLKGISIIFRLIPKFQKDRVEVRRARKALRTCKDAAYLKEVRDLISRVRGHLQP
jgi:hypothetical protein